MFVSQINQFHTKCLFSVAGNLRIKFPILHESRVLQNYFDAKMVVTNFHLQHEQAMVAIDSDGRPVKGRDIWTHNSQFLEFFTRMRNIGMTYSK